MTDARDPVFDAPAGRGKRRLKRRGFASGLALLLVLGIGALLLVSSIPLALPSARQDIEARLERLTGNPVHVDGNAEFSLFPRARMVLTDVRIGTGAGEEALDLDIDRVEADFDLLDALRGGVDIKRVTLIRPELAPGRGAAEAGRDVLAPPPTGGAIDPAITAAAIDSAGTSRYLKSLLVRFEGLNELRIRDGLFRLPDRPGGISNANVIFRWETPTAPATLSGSYVWNGQPTEIDARIDQPLPFFEGTISPLRVQLASPTIQTAFVGQGAAGAALRLSGGLQLEAPSFSRAIRWLGESSLTLPDFGAFSIETQIEVVGDKINFSAANLDLGGNKAHGALEGVLTGENRRPSVSGTLAFEQLDFAGLTQAIAPAPRTLIDLQRPLRVAFISQVDMDLRLSAVEASFGPVAMSEIAATVKMADGAAMLDIGDMAVFGGRGAVRMGLETGFAGPSLTLVAGLRGIRMADLSGVSKTPLPLASGTGDLDLTVNSPAVNWGEILMRNQSQLDLRVSDGSLSGFERAMLGDGGEHPVVISASAIREPFLRLEARARSLGPRVRFDTLSVGMESGQARASGLYDLRNGQISVAGQFDPTTVEASGSPIAFTPSKPIEFTIAGEWPEPTMTVGPPVEPI